MIIRDKDLATLQEIFSTVDLPFEVWAYGSRVTGEAHKGSDLDLVIRNHKLEQVPLKTLTILQTKIRESNIPIIVELFDWARLPQSFHRNIEKNHEVLFSNTKSLTS